MYIKYIIWPRVACRCVSLYITYLTGHNEFDAVTLDL